MPFRKQTDGRTTGPAPLLPVGPVSGVAFGPTPDLFAAETRSSRVEHVALAPSAVHLRAFAVADAPSLVAALQPLIAAAPFRRMVTPGGFTMSVSMTNCGALGWVTDRTGYRYSARDPETGLPWPAMPLGFTALAARAATVAGFDGFEPDACLINRYEPGARLSLHQDADEHDFAQPIVSVSLGLPATFLFGGLTRGDKAQRVALDHGDVVVWGGADRMRYHGVLALKVGEHALLGRQRINLTFRKAG